MRKRIVRLSVATATVGALALPMWGPNLAADAAGASAPTVVTSGLNNPRQLSLTDDNVLLVAEAGKGGQCGVGGNEELCAGLTGSISALFEPATANKVSPIRVVTGLVSGAQPDGSFAVGSDGVSARRFLNASIFIQETFAPTDTLPQSIPSETTGKLLYAWPGRPVKVASDISKYEQTVNPDGQEKDSNPYAVLDLGDHRLVADAAANVVLSVDAKGKISTFHVFPNITTTQCTTPNPETDWPGYDPSPAFPGCHFVPTSLAKGPNGDIYVGGLASEQEGQAQVVQLDAKTGAVKKTWSGFTTVHGVAVGKDGTLYVSELFAPPSGPGAPGQLTKVAKNGEHTSIAVPLPGGVAVDSANNVYVSAYTGSPETGSADAPPGVDTSGQVWRVRF